MKPRSIVKGIVSAVAMAFTLAPASFAQPAAPAAATAQARLDRVEGNVLVSTATGLAAGGAGQALLAGTRVITPANGKALIKFDNGCSVQLQPNQRLVIDPSKSCEQLTLLVQSTLPAPPAPSPPPSGFLASAAPSGGLPDFVGNMVGGVMGATAIIRWRQDENVSPN